MAPGWLPCPLAGLLPFPCPLPLPLPFLLGRFVPHRRHVPLVIQLGAPHLQLHSGTFDDWWHFLATRPARAGSLPLLEKFCRRGATTASPRAFGLTHSQECGSQYPCSAHAQLRSKRSLLPNAREQWGMHTTCRMAHFSPSQASFHQSLDMVFLQSLQEARS